MEEQKQNLSSPAYWIDMLCQKGVLVVAESFGVMFLLKAYISLQFNMEAAIIGTILIVAGAAFEYLVWIQKSYFLNQRIKSLEEKSKKLDEQILELSNKFLDSAPAAGGKDKQSSSTDGFIRSST